MGISLSQGPYDYNRFEAHEASLAEASKKVASGAADRGPEDDYSKTAKAAGYGSDTKKFGDALLQASGKVKGGDPRREFSRLRSDSKYFDKAMKYAKNKESAERAFAKEELNTENEVHQMDSYIQAISNMAANPSYGSYIMEKETEAERKEAADRAAEEKRQKKEGKKGEAHETEELEKDEDKMLSKGSNRKPDYLDFDKDGNKKESMKKALKDKKEEVDYIANEMIEFAEAHGYEVELYLTEAKRGRPAKKVAKVTGVEGKAMEQGYKKNINPETGKHYGATKKEQSEAAAKSGARKAMVKKMSKAAGNVSKNNPGGKPGAGGRLLDMADKIKKATSEEVIIDKEDVIDWLVAEEYATNEVSAEIMFDHMSDDFLSEIEADITEFVLSEMGPAYPSETKAQAKAQADHRSGKSSAGLKTGKNPGLKMSHTSGANRQA